MNCIQYSECILNEEKIIANKRLFQLEQQFVLMSPIHRIICALVFTDPKGGCGYGTAFLLSTDLLLTVAHNIYSKENKKKGGENSNFKLYLGACGAVSDQYEIQSWRLLEQYKTCDTNKNRIFDYALMKLKRPVPYKNYIEIGLDCQQCQKWSNADKLDKIGLEIYGYPLQRNYEPLNTECNQIQIFQFGCSKNSNAVERIDYSNGMIYYNVSTLPGQSGCPVISKGNIIAIHIGGLSPQEVNVGRLMTFDVIENLYTWSKQLKAHPFSINVNSICSHYKDYKIIKELTQTPKIKEQAQQQIFQTQEQIILNQAQQTIGQPQQQIDLNSLKEIKQALFNKAQKLYSQKKLDEALQDFKQCLKYQARFGNQNIEKSFILLQIGNIFLQKGNYKKAISSFDQSIKIRDHHSVKDWAYNSAVYNTAVAYCEKQDYVSAMKYYMRSQNIGKEIKQQKFIELSLEGIQSCVTIINRNLNQLKQLKKKQQNQQ